MDERTDDMNDMDDMDFVKLFSSLDSVKASDDLKTATLDAIFAGAGDDPTAPEEDGSKAKVVKFPRKGAHSKSNSHRLRIAGIAACFALLGTVGTAFNMPTSYASVDYDDTNLTIGINPLGVAVSADSDSEKGKKLIADNDLTNVDYRDSIGTIATTIATHSEEPESTIELSVSSDNESQRANVKKGSSEAIEISGYKKKAKKTTAPSKAVDANAEDVEDPTADSGADNPAATTADEDEGADSFVINTSDAQDEQEASKAEDAVEPSSKYHPLSDNKESSEAETETNASNESGTDDSSSTAAENADSESNAESEEAPEEAAD